MENEIIVSGKSIRVIKETERGIIILFRSETIQNVTVEKSSEPYCDDDRNNNNNNIIEEEEQEENEIKSSSKKRSNEKTDSSNKKKKSKSITKYKDYYLCGDLCSEITSPLIIYTIKIKKNDYNDLYIISEIVNFNLEFRLPLTKKILKQSLIKSEYFYGLPTKIINDLLNPLDTTYRLSLNGPILEERILNCLFCGEKGKILRYICKNIFKDKKYYERVSSYGNVALSQLCESELKILELNPNDDRKELELIILGDDIDKEEFFDEFEYKLIEKRLSIFEKICFLNPISKEQKNIALINCNEIWMDSEEKFESIWHASCIFNEMIEKSNFFGDSCYMKQQKDDRWTIEVIDILKKHVCVWKNLEKENEIYIFTLQVEKAQNEIVDKLNKIKSLTVVKAENDTDHISSIGYFDFLRSLIKKHRTEMVIITTLDKRKRYLSDNTNFNYVYTFKEIANVSSKIVIVIDRCHILGLHEFHKMIMQFNTDQLHLYLCGSTLCLTENIGQPFQDIYKKFCCVNYRVQSDRKMISEDIQIEKIDKKFDDIPSMLNEYKPKGLMYIITNSKKEKQDLLNMGIDKEIGTDSIKTINELKYQDTSRTTMTIFIKDESQMNKNKLAKCISCASTKPKSVVIIGNDDDLDKVMNNSVNYSHKSILSKIIELRSLNIIVQ